MKKWVKKLTRYFTWVLDWHFRPVYAWHFIERYGNFSNDMSSVKAKPGLTLRKWRPWRIELCAHGFHASIDPYDAYNYWSRDSGTLCRVKLGGVIKHDSNKLVASRRTIVWMADVSDELCRLRSWRRDNYTGLCRDKLNELLKPIKERYERHR